MHPGSVAKQGMRDEIIKCGCFENDIFHFKLATEERPLSNRAHFKGKEKRFEGQVMSSLSLKAAKVEAKTSGARLAPGVLN